MAKQSQSKSSHTANGSTPARIKLIEAVTTPLGFFVLALLIVEAFLATVLVWAELNSTDKMIGVWLGVGLFILVVGVVTILVWHRPMYLTFDKDAHLLDRGKVPYGSNQAQISPAALFDSSKQEEPKP